jgi:glycosyltransferase involved in cell wall biosynthesis
MKIIKKKIIFSIHGLSTGGAEKFLVSLVNKLDYSQFDCMIISYSKNNPLACELNKEVKLKIFSRNSKFDLKPFLETREYIKVYEPDLFFCVGFFSFALIHISSIFNSPKIPRIISYHTTIHRNRKDHLMMKLFSKFIRNTDKIVTVCNNQIDYTTQEYKIKPSFFTAIYNGVDTNHWRLPKTVEEASLIRDQFKIPHDAKVIIKTAAFRPEKNHKAAVDAFSLLNKKGLSNVFLLFVGDGILKSEVQDYVDKLNLSDKIIFVGNQIDVRPFYWASDFFTLTSNGVETFSIAALEALSCGLPCVLTDIGGANEMIQEGVNGYLTSTNSENIAEQWNKTLTTFFDKGSISLGVKRKFNLDLMIKNYEELLS